MDIRAFLHFGARAGAILLLALFASMPSYGDNANHSGQLVLGAAERSTDGLFINWFKGAQHWVNCSGGLGVNPALLDSDGYPKKIVNGGVCTNFPIPSQTELPGNYAIIWDGSGTLANGFCKTTISGGSSSSPWLITPCTTEISNIGITATMPNNRIHNLNFIWIGNCKTLQLKNNCGDYDDWIAGKYFRSSMMKVLRDAKFGSVRFLSWQGGACCGGNITNVTTWATRKPLTYAYWGVDGAESKHLRWCYDQQWK